MDTIEHWARPLWRQVGVDWDLAGHATAEQHAAFDKLLTPEQRAHADKVDRENLYRWALGDVHPLMAPVELELFAALEQASQAIVRYRILQDDATAAGTAVLRPAVQKLFSSLFDPTADGHAA